MSIPDFGRNTSVGTKTLHSRCRAIRRHPRQLGLFCFGQSERITTRRAGRDLCDRVVKLAPACTRCEYANASSSGGQDRLTSTRSNPDSSSSSSSPSSTALSASRSRVRPRRGLDGFRPNAAPPPLAAADDEEEAGTEPSLSPVVPVPAAACACCACSTPDPEPGLVTDVAVVDDEEEAESPGCCCCC